MRREIVYDAIHHKNTGQIPHNVELASDLLKRFCEYAKIKEQEYGDFADNYVAKCSLNQKDVDIGNNCIRDEYGVVFDRTYDKDIGVIQKYLIPEPDVSLIQIPPIDREAVKTRVTAFMNDGRDMFKFAKIGFSLFERLWTMCGFENTFLYLLTEQDFVKELLRRITERNLALIEIALECGVDGIYFGDDYGSQRGLLFSREVFREVFLPSWEAQFSLIKVKGKATCLHCCGNIIDILPDLINAGLDIYQTVQPELYDFRELKERFPQLSYYGGISLQRDLPVLKADQIDELVQNTAGVLAAGGGYIAAPTHQVTKDVPVENVMALIESFKKLRN